MSGYHKNKLSKPILFVDFNGVISYRNFWHSLTDKNHNLHKYSEAIEKYLFVDNITVVQDWMLGKYSSEQIHRLLADKLSVPYDELLEVFIADCEEIDISQGIVERIDKLRPHFKCILVTDNMDSFDRFTLKKSKLDDHFDEIYNSYNLKSAKKDNNGELFVRLVAENGVDIEQCIFIDDSAKNIQLFKDLGGIGVLATGENSVIQFLDKLYKEYSN